MKLLSLKLRDEVFQEVERVLHTIKMPRNAYINHALIFYNQLHKRKLRKQQLHHESQVVRAESLAVLKEFERLEDALPE